MRLDTDQEGLNCLYLPHTAKILQHIWDERAIKGQGMSVLHLFEWYNQYAPEWGLKKKSRATIQSSLTELVRDKVIEYYPVPDRGGMKFMYYQVMSPIMFSVHVKEKMGDKLGEVFNFEGPWWKPFTEAKP